MLGWIRAVGEGDGRVWDGWMASSTRWTWLWVNSGSWWWTGRPGVLQFMGSQRVGHNWVTELNWTEWSTMGYVCVCSVVQLCPTLWTFYDPVDCSPSDSLSMGFSRQEYWSGLPFPAPGDLPDPGIKPLHADPKSHSLKIRLNFHLTSLLLYFFFLLSFK